MEIFRKAGFGVQIGSRWPTRAVRPGGEVSMRHALLVSFVLLSASPRAWSSPVSLVALSNNSAGQNGAPVGSGTLARLAMDGSPEATATVARSGVALAWDSRADVTYGVMHHAGGAQLLVELDPHNLTVTREIGALADSDDANYLHKVTALAVDGEGALWGIAARRTEIGGIPVPAGVLVHIEPETARATPIGNLGFPVYGRGGAIYDGSFLLVCHTDRYDTSLSSWRVDLEDGSATLLGPVGAKGASVGLAEDDSGTIWAVLGDDTSDLYTIDPATGAGQRIGTTHLQALSGLTFVRSMWARHLNSRWNRLPDDEDCDDSDGDDCGDDDDIHLRPFDLAAGAVAEARIGDLGGRATFELDAGVSTAAPALTAQKAWVSGQSYPFRVVVPPGAATWTWEVDGTALVTAPIRGGRDLTVRARSIRPDARMTVSDLVLDGTEVGLVVDTDGPWAVKGEDIVHIHTRWLDDGFVMSGNLTFTWDSKNAPRNSQLAMQIGWGEAATAWR
jgi:hypothetical protein